MNPRPINLELDGDDHLLIAWSDDQTRRYRLRELVEHCPCASCREKRRGAGEQQGDGLLPVIKPEEAQPLRLAGVEPVGSYAYSIRFNHGCQNGIYTFEHLQRLGRPLEPPG